MKGQTLKIDNMNKDWNDKDQVMIKAVFQILCDFMEQEHPNKVTDYTYNKEHRQRWRELQTLYKYWKIDRPKDQKKIDKLLHMWAKKHKTKCIPKEVNINGKIFKCSEMVTLVKAKKEWNRLNKAEKEFDAKEDEMLIRVMKIRRHLWT